MARRMQIMPFTFARARLPLLAALLTSTLVACSSGNVTPSTGGVTTTNPPARLLSNNAVIASPPGYPHLVTTTAPKTLSAKSFSPPSTDVELFHDNFYSGVATGWSVAQGAWTVPAGTGEYTGTTSGNAVFAGDDAWTNYGVEAYFRPENSSGSRRGMVLIAHAIDANHFYQIEFANESDGNRWELWRNDGGNYVSLGSGTYPYVDDHQYLVQLKTFGSNISVSIADGYNREFVNVASVTDSTYTHGRIGLRLWGGATSRFDDVRVWTTSSAAPAPSSTSAPASSGSIAPPGTQPFPSGPFNVPVNSPQFDSNSSTYISSALAGNSYNLGMMQFGVNATGPTDSSVPVYTAHNSDPHYRVHCRYFSNCPLEGADIAIPAGALPAGHLGYTSFTDDGVHDQHMAIRNVDTQTETDMWLAPEPSGNGGTLEIGYGGSLPFSSQGVGGAGATASGFSLTQGRVRAVDLIAGHLPTALFLVTPCENGHVAPAIADDGGRSWGCPPLGAHVWLDSSSGDIASSGASPDVQVILNAMHEYGGFIGDRCSSCTLGIALEGGLAYSAFALQNPWIQIAAMHPGEETAAPPGGDLEYHIAVSSGNIDLRSHLHVIR